MLKNVLNLFDRKKRYIDDLISRFLSDESDEPQKGGVFESAKTVSWKAHREAETLKDEQLIPILIDRIESEADKRSRDAAYFILGHLAKNTKNVQVVPYLIDRQWIEQDKYVASAILDRIADIPKPLGTDVTKLVEATRDENWLIRHSAIRALDNSADPQAEQRLIEISEDGDDPFDVIYANSVLNKVGTSRAIPTLQKHLKSRKRDVRLSAELAIQAIRNRKS